MRMAPRKYQVAIPSFQRAEGIAKKTLPFLLNGGVDPARITIYLHDNDPQLEQYQALAEQHGVTVKATAMRGITPQRTFITNDYPEGTPLVCIDDDVTDVMEALDAKTLRPVQDVDGLFTMMFRETAARDLYLWGLAPVINAFYMKPGRISEGLKFLIFSLFGCYVRPGHPVNEFTVPYKDEHEMSLRAWWWDGAVVRHDGMSAKANFYTDPGGCQAETSTKRTPEKVAYSVAELQRQWPGLVRINDRKKDTGYVEITLTPKKRHGGHPVTTPPPGDRAKAAA
ncbi:hypothetical protein GS982_20145 [Rhodococcus hoagii]|nr:hypothetical protein [Prescottella equi]NKZ84514.1 hypothetical protein [Prescottella equi]